jgi:hypothetical protein
MQRSLAALTLLLLALATALLAGCATYPYASEGERALAMQPASPLIPGQDTLLARNDWRVVEVRQGGEPVQVAALAPVVLTFGAENGTLLVRQENCNTGHYVIAAEDEHRYRLYPLETTAMGCGEFGDRQAADLHRALAATTQFTVTDNLLVLAGDDARIVAQIEQPPQQPQDVWCFDLVTYADGRHTIFGDAPGGGAGVIASTLPGVTMKQRCFPTWTEAAYYITGGTVILPPTATQQDYLEAVNAFLDRPIPELNSPQRR